MPKNIVSNISADDRFNIITDLTMPFLAQVLDPVLVQHQLTQCLSPSYKNADRKINLQAIRVMRYKPGRRCLIEYDLQVAEFRSSQIITLIGKVRAKGTDRHTHALQQALWQLGFSDNSADGISVPEPIALIPAWNMTLQRKVAGTVATQLFHPNSDIALVKRIAAAAHKLHQANISPHRQHTIHNELQILHDRLPRVLQHYPQWEPRLKRVLQQCDRLAANTPEPRACGIHRDFYADQVIVQGDRLYLIDLDLYCQGNPALDIGNFIAHMTEQSLRLWGNPNALSEQETALAEDFMRISGLPGNGLRLAVQSYTTLTLARHIYLSTQFADRRSLTPALLELCEQRLNKH